MTFATNNIDSSQSDFFMRLLSIFVMNFKLFSRTDELIAENNKQVREFKWAMVNVYMHAFLKGSNIFEIKLFCGVPAAGSWLDYTYT